MENFLPTNCGGYKHGPLVTYKFIICKYVNNYIDSISVLPLATPIFLLSIRTLDDCVTALTQQQAMQVDGHNYVT